MAGGRRSPHGGQHIRYRSAGRYYHFRADSLIKVDTKRISTRAINQIDARNLLRELFAAPPLGINEAVWLSLSGDPGYFTNGKREYRWQKYSADHGSIAAYQSAGYYYHFRQGTLVKRSTELSPADEIAQIDPLPFRIDYYAQSPLGMRRREWLRPLVMKEGAVSVYHSDGAFLFFKNGLLVKTDLALIPPRQIATLDEAKIFAENYRPQPRKNPNHVRWRCHGVRRRPVTAVFRSSARPTIAISVTSKIATQNRIESEAGMIFAAPLATG